MTIEEAIRELEEDKAMYMPREWIEELDRDTPDGRLITALEMAIKSLETIQRIDDVLNVEGMTEIDVLDEIMEAMSEFKYDCGVDE